MIGIIERILRRINIYFKILYFKCKYGKSLVIGKKLRFRRGFRINISKNGYLKIGDNNFFNDYCSINVHNKVIIGEKNLFGKNVNIYDHNHIFDKKNVNKGKSFYTNQVEIGNNNWFGTNVIILSKSKLENNNVISAGVVINEKIDSNNIIKTKSELKKRKINYKD